MTDKIYVYPDSFHRRKLRPSLIFPFLFFLSFSASFLTTSPLFAETHPTGQIYVITTTDATEIDTSTWQNVQGVQVIDTEGATCGESFTYAAVTYSTVLIGDQCWMGENLNLGTRVAGTVTMTDNDILEKHCYADTEANCTAEGGLYQWDEAMDYVETAGTQGICPEGWHIPTDAEWHTLENHLWDGVTGACSSTRTTYDCSPAGDKLKTAADCYSGSNCGTSGFEGLLAGLRNTDGSFIVRGTLGYFWSSSVSGAYAWNRYLNSGRATVYRYTYDQAVGFSVRCLKD